MTRADANPTFVSKDRWSRRWLNVLVLWYGAYQAAHIIFNGLYLLDPSLPPFPAPPGDWQPQTVDFLNPIAAGDLLNAIISLFFVVGYFRYAPWTTWTGSATLAVSVYGTTVFTYGTVTSGAWEHSSLEYMLLLPLPFLPIVALATIFVILGFRGRLTSHLQRDV